jgi:AcrR family transcriptional regulator
VVLDRGAGSTTIGAIANASGAPKGSIYHRFSSRGDLLAAMWVRAVRRSQAEFVDALDDPDPVSAAVGAARSLYDFAERNPGDARLLASLRREDLQGTGSRERDHELAELNDPLARGLTKLARRLFGRASAANVDRTVSAVVDLPLGLTRRHLIAGSSLPRGLAGQLEAAVRAAITHEKRRSDVPQR